MAVKRQRPTPHGEAWNPKGLAILMGNRRARARAVFQPRHPPKSIVAEYTRDLLKIVEDVNNLVERFLFPVLEKYEQAFKGVQTIHVVGDSIPGRVRLADDSFGFQLQTAYTSIKMESAALDRIGSRIATQRMNQVNTAHRREFLSAFQREAGVNVSNLLSPGLVLTGRTIDGSTATVNQAIQNNIDLIKTIPTEHLDKVKAAVTKGLASGSDAHSIRAAVLKINNGDRYRARLIARDQTQKLFSVLEQARQQEIGITSYIWRTVEDESVRETHQANNGQTFQWDSPPAETGHPGEDINCRCTAEPDLSSLTEVVEPPAPAIDIPTPSLTPAPTAIPEPEPPAPAPVMKIQPEPPVPAVKPVPVPAVKPVPVPAVKPVPVPAVKPVPVPAVKPVPVPAPVKVKPVKVKPTPTPTPAPAPVKPAPALTKDEVVQQNIRNSEDTIYMGAKETAIVFDENGKELYRVKGKVDHVAYTRTEYEGMRGKRMTHNHPNDSCHSAADIFNHVNLERIESRATGKKYTYVVKGKTTTPAPVVKAEVEAAEKIINKLVDDLIDTGLRAQYKAEIAPIQIEKKALQLEATKLMEATRNLATYAQQGKELKKVKAWYGRQALILKKKETAIWDTIVNDKWFQMMFEKHIEIGKKHGLIFERVKRGN
jgi:SPP1 gp7 family putative phage head morphogenesis protein